MNDSVEVMVKLTMPDIVQAMMQEIQAVGSIDDFNETTITIKVEASSEFDAGVTVNELTHTLTSIFGESIEIS